MVVGFRLQRTGCWADWFVRKRNGRYDAGNIGAYNCKIDEPAYLEVLREYQTSAKKVRTTLLILQFPVLALLLAFIFMISRQMLDLEQNEIALLKSRGSSKKQIILIYFLQSVILSAMSAVVGLPLGYFLCKALGSTNGFLEFIQRKSITYHAWYFGIFV